MKTYSSVKEAIRSGIAFSSTTAPRRHTFPYNSSYTESTTSTSQSNSNSNSTSSSPSHSSFNNTFEIRLNPENIAPETLDISQYTYQDLQDLKKSDPFFYYSIPEIHLRSYGCTRHHLNGSGAAGWQGSAAMEDEGVDEAVEEEQQEEEQGGKDTAQEQEQEQEDDQGGGDQPRRRRRSSNDYRRASLPPNFLQHSRRHDNNHKHQLHIPIHQGPVTKSRRLSVEAHPSLIVESMMLYEEEEGTDNDNILGNHLGDVNLNDDSDDDDSDDMEEEMLLRILGGDCTSMPEITGEEEDDNES